MKIIEPVALLPGVRVSRGVLLCSYTRDWTQIHHDEETRWGVPIEIVESICAGLRVLINGSAARRMSQNG